MDMWRGSYQHNVRVVGKHQVLNGSQFLGDRLNVGELRSFISAVTIETNTIYTGLSSEHPGFFRSALFIEKSEVHWIRQDMILNNRNI
jgi:tRNA-specific 2-thiouridylase